MDVKNNNAIKAVKNALTVYAETLGVSFEEAVELYKQHESTKQAVHVLVILLGDGPAMRRFVSSFMANQ